MERLIKAMLAAAGRQIVVILMAMATLTGAMSISLLVRGAGAIERQFVKPAEAAEALGVSRAQLYLILRRGELGAIVKEGRATLIPVRAVRAWADKKVQEAEARAKDLSHAGA